MPKSPNSSASADSFALASADSIPPLDLLVRKSDALYRAAIESCRQHRRYSAVVECGASAKEQNRTRALVTLCDDHLAEAADSYEKTAGRTDGLRAEEWWRRANALWLAARECARRHSASRRSSRHLELQDANTIYELSMDYDLEASALLALSQAADAYRKVRPEADLCPPKAG